MIHSTSHDILCQLGAGQRISEVCEAAGMPRDQFESWWKDQCQRRVPSTRGRCRLRVRRAVRVDRDKAGVPYIHAQDDGDLFFTLGYLVAQDRLFQIDYLRRKATGRLAEILGPEALESDRTYRTLGLAQIAETEWRSLPDETRGLLQAYTDGVNAWIDDGNASRPIEFALLNYQPHRWSPQDSLAIEGEFRWYLTGRLPVIVVPELIKRRLGDGPLYHATLVGEADEESILWPGDYPHALRRGPIGPTGDGGVDSPGSNNWALSAGRTATGSAVIAGDPHLLFSAQSIWFEARLKGGSFDVAGMTLAGLPGVMIGRTPRIAWTITNNICSQRDLYQEQLRPGAPPCFLYDERWEPAVVRREAIEVQGGGRTEMDVLHSRNGPIVDELLPSAARGTGPVSLRWVGQQPCGWLTALLDMNRATSVAAYCEATRPWLCPTWNVLCADVEGHIGLQTTGRIPIRNVWERGFRPGWDPRHQWSGLTSFQDMPRLIDPGRGYLVTANNRLAPDDYPIPLDCTSTSGHRARRIRQEIERRGKLTVQDSQQMQFDVVSLRAAECVPLLLDHLRDCHDERVREAANYLRAWDYRVLASSVAASLFHAFFARWLRAVAVERLSSPDIADERSQAVAQLATDRLGGLAVRLLASDPQGWFRSPRTSAIVAAFKSSLGDLSERLGDNMADWQWGKIHTLRQPHYLSGRGDLGSLLDQSGLPMSGDGTTVHSATPDARFAAYLGAGYRSVVDLGDPGLGMWVIDAASGSGHPGSPNYGDQLEPWSRGEYRYLSLDADRAADSAVCSLHIEPSEATS